MRIGSELSGSQGKEGNVMLWYILGQAGRADQLEERSFSLLS